MMNTVQQQSYDVEFSIIQHIKRENVIPPLKLKQRVVPEKWYLDPPQKTFLPVATGHH